IIFEETHCYILESIIYRARSAKPQDAIDECSEAYKAGSFQIGKSSLQLFAILHFILSGLSAVNLEILRSEHITEEFKAVSVLFDEDWNP
ncbi:3786_t:CDS:2, partial [Funneliformis geosporum]